MTFPEWVIYNFDHPVTEPAWYWSDEGDWEAPDLEMPQIAAYLTRLFAESGTVLLPYSDAQVGQGLNVLINNCLSDDIFSLLAPEVPLEDRLRGIRAMEAVFRDCFARRCSPHLSHLDELGVSPLNGICYMWWDILPITAEAHFQPERPDSVEIDRICLDIMQRTLKIDSIACRESALHGLAHWSHYYPEVERIIDAFLKRHPTLRPDLRTYAKAARHGRVQ